MRLVGDLTSFGHVPHPHVQPGTIEVLSSNRLPEFYPQERTVEHYFGDITCHCNIEDAQLGSASSIEDQNLRC